MTLTDIWPTLQLLSIDDKRRLVQVLSAELSHAEEASLIPIERDHAVWTPLDADEAASTMLRLIQGPKS